MAVEVAARGIRANAASPGVISTSAFEVAEQAGHAQMLSQDGADSELVSP